MIDEVSDERELGTAITFNHPSSKSPCFLSIIPPNLPTPFFICPRHISSTEGGYHIEDISPVLKRTDIIEKDNFAVFAYEFELSQKMMYRLRRYDVLRNAQYDVNSLRSFMMRSVP